MDRQAQALIVREVTPEHAAQRLSELEQRDPRRLAGRESLLAMARGGRCFELHGEGGAYAVYLLHLHGDAVWVEAAEGQGPVNLCRVLNAVIADQAQGASSIGFMTERKGLVRQAERLGWRVAGWVMRKDLHAH